MDRDRNESRKPFLTVSRVMKLSPGGMGPSPRGQIASGSSPTLGFRPVVKRGLASHPVAKLPQGFFTSPTYPLDAYRKVC
jgi:hypothetical protein